MHALLTSIRLTRVVVQIPLLLFQMDASTYSSTVIPIIRKPTFAVRPLKQKADFTQDHYYFGVRFRPGVIPDLLNLDVEEVISNRLDLGDLVYGAEKILEQVCKADDFLGKARAVNDFVSQFDSRTCSHLTMEVIARVTKARGNIQIQDLVNDTGYSARTLQRTFRNDTGLTPKRSAARFAVSQQCIRSATIIRYHCLSLRLIWVSAIKHTSSENLKAGQCDANGLSVVD